MGSFGRGLANAVGASVADPYLTDLITPDMVTALLGKGRLKPVTVENRTLTFDRTVPTLDEILKGRLAHVLLNSYYDGPISFVMHAGGPDAESYGLHLRLEGAAWRLAGLDIPDAIVNRIVADILAREKAARQS